MKRSRWATACWADCSGAKEAPSASHSIAAICGMNGPRRRRNGGKNAISGRGGIWSPGRISARSTAGGTGRTTASRPRNYLPGGWRSHRSVAESLELRVEPGRGRRDCSVERRQAIGSVFQRDGTGGHVANRQPGAEMDYARSLRRETASGRRRSQQRRRGESVGLSPGGLRQRRCGAMVRAGVRRGTEILRSASRQSGWATQLWQVTITMTSTNDGRRHAGLGEKTLCCGPGRRLRRRVQAARCLVAQILGQVVRDHSSRGPAPSRGSIIWCSISMGPPRAAAPPMPLQGVWTADNGGLPPWKGDTEVIRLFPAVAWRWHDLSFIDLRAEGGCRVSAKRENNATTWFRITAGRTAPFGFAITSGAGCRSGIAQT